jgi:hypothetical protein
MNALSIRTHQHFIRHDKARGDREFFVTSVQPELSGQGGVIHLVYRDTGRVRRVPFAKAEQFFATAVPLQEAR